MSLKREYSPDPSFLPDNSSFGDMDVFLDFGDGNFMPSPTPANQSMLSISSSTASPAPQFAAPSHPYNLHVQQTDVFGMEFEQIFADSPSYVQLDTNEANRVSTSQQESSSLPPYFYPEPPVASGSHNSSPGISPLTIVSELHTTPRLTKAALSPSRQHLSVSRPAPHATVIGHTSSQSQPPRVNHSCYHQEMVAYTQNMRGMVNHEKTTQPDAPIATKPQQHPQEGKIHAILNSFKSPPVSTGTSRSQSELLPHIARMKKEEEQMDDDERLLASEEGKRLSSKERRQLRNKVSARAFRSRRKEYISQLEAEVAKKAQEAEEAKEAEKRLEEENKRLRGFTEMLMKHSAFQEFLNDMTIPLTNPGPTPQQQSLQPPIQPQQQQLQPQPQLKSAHLPPYNRTRDQIGFTSSEEQWPLAYTSNNWNTPHVFAMDVPSEWPVIPELESKMAYGEDYSIADGFFANIRDEKGNVDLSRMHEEAYCDNGYEEEVYQPPENIEDVIVEEELRKKSNLDELFPGIGVNSLLERLELIAGGEAIPEDLFEMERSEDDLERESGISQKSIRNCRSVCVSNRILQEAEGVYRRIGMTVGG